MTLLAAGARRESRWKNGGGSTVEIAVSPEGAGLDDFDWRISMARIERDAPFSVFPGIDRVLTVVEGALVLEVFGAPAIKLDAASPPHAFSGDVSTFGQVVGGAVVDLNVMTRRGVFHAEVTMLELGAAREVAAKGGDAFLIVLEGALNLHTPEARVEVGAQDVWRGRGGLWRLEPAPSARALLVQFRGSDFVYDGSIRVGQKP